MLSLRALSLGVAFTLAIGCAPEKTPTLPLDTPECDVGAWLGSFHGSASGAVTDTLAGCAYYSWTTTEPTLFGLTLTDGSPQAAALKVRIWVLGGTSTGTQIPVGAQPGEVSGFVLVGDRDFALTDGTISLVEVRSADNSTLMRQGSIDLTAVESETGASITVSGSFLASCVEPDPDAPPRCVGTAGF